MGLQERKVWDSSGQRTITNHETRQGNLRIKTNKQIKGLGTSTGYSNMRKSSRGESSISRVNGEAIASVVSRKPGEISITASKKKIKVYQKTEANMSKKT